MSKSLCYRPFRTADKAPESQGLGKTRKIRQILRSPVQVLAREWSGAITQTDAHSRVCQPCNRRRQDPGLQVTMGALLDAKLDPYRPCRKAEALELAERAARQAYLAAGGVLPVVRAMVMLMLVPLGILL